MDELQSFFAEMRRILKTYPRHIEGKVIQQGGFSILHETAHKWKLPPEKVHDLLKAADLYWKQN